MWSSGVITTRIISRGDEDMFSLGRFNVDYPIRMKGMVLDPTLVAWKLIDGRRLIAEALLVRDRVYHLTTKKASAGPTDAAGMYSSIFMPSLCFFCCICRLVLRSCWGCYTHWENDTLVCVILVYLHAFHLLNSVPRRSSHILSRVINILAYIISRS